MAAGLADYCRRYAGFQRMIGIFRYHRLAIIRLLATPLPLYSPDAAAAADFRFSTPFRRRRSPSLPRRFDFITPPTLVYFAHADALRRCLRHATTLAFSRHAIFIILFRRCRAALFSLTPPLDAD